MKEQEMIELLLHRDENGMKELLIHYGPLMRYIVAPILSNAQDQEDCLSEVAMQVWKKIELFDSKRGSWNGWLTAITRNYALNYKRSMMKNDNRAEITLDIPSPELSPEEQVIKKERQDALKYMLLELSPGDRTLFYRKYYYLQSTAQIASEMGTTERAVEGRLYRIKKKLRKMMGGEGYEQS